MSLASGTSYAYDAAGDRTNAGSATGMTWDAERRLVGWTSGSGATVATAAYDGEGNRGSGSRQGTRAS